MPLAIKSYGGVACGATGTPYDLYPMLAADWHYGADTDLRDRQGDAPIQDGERQLSREIRCLLRPGSTANADRDLWWQDAVGVFTPDGRARTLVVTWEAVDYQADAAVIDLGNASGVPMRDTGDVLRVLIFQLADPVWQAVTPEAADAASPLTVGGNTEALPVITVTPITSTLSRARITVTDVLGIGGHAYPVIATFDSTLVGATTANDYIAFCNHRSIPFQVRDPNTATTDLFVSVDVPQGSSVTVDVYFGSSVNNTLTPNQLPSAGRAFTDTNWSNTNWVWAFDGTVDTHPTNVSGVWYLANTGGHFTGSTTVMTQTASSIVFTGTSTPSPTDLQFDSIVMVLGGSLAGTTNALSGLRRVIATTPSNIRGFVRYLALGDLVWRDAWTSSSAGTVDTAIDLDNAIAIAIGLDTIGATPSGSLTISAVPATDFALALASNPSVSTAAPVTARLIDSVLTNTTTGDTLTFDEVYVDNVAVTIDCEKRGAISPASGPLYGAIVPSNKALMLPLAVGNNSWTNGADFTTSFQWRNRIRV